MTSLRNNSPQVFLKLKTLKDCSAHWKAAEKAGISLGKELHWKQFLSLSSAGQSTLKSAASDELSPTQGDRSNRLLDDARHRLAYGLAYIHKR